MRFLSVALLAALGVFGATAASAQDMNAIFSRAVNAAVNGAVNDQAKKTPPGTTVTEAGQVDHVPELTAPLLTSFVAVNTALQQHYHTSDLAAMLETAQRPVIRTTLRFGKDSMTSIAFDGAALAASDPALAAIFTAQHFTPSQLAMVQAAVQEALGTLFTMRLWNAPPPAATSRLGKNVALVRDHEHELAVFATALTIPAQLTDARVTHYLALRQALQAYWAAHVPLRDTAVMTELHPWFFAIGSNWFKVTHVYDYPVLVTHDAALAALFAAHDLTPEQYIAVQVSIYAALMDLIGYEKDPDGTPIPMPPAVAGTNVEVVRRHRNALLAADLMPYQAEPIALNATGVQGVMLDSAGTSWYIRPMKP